MLFRTQEQLPGLAFKIHNNNNERWLKVASKLELNLSLIINHKLQSHAHFDPASHFSPSGFHVLHQTRTSAESYQLVALP